MRKYSFALILFSFLTLITSCGSSSETVEDNGVTGAENNNASPVAQINAPIDGSSYIDGHIVRFEGNCTDSEDGSLNNEALVWHSNLDGQIGVGETFTSNTLSAGIHLITLTGTDAGGSTGMDTVSISVGAPHSHATAIPQNNGVDNSNEIDVIQDNCGEEEAEPFLPFTAIVVIETSSAAPEFLVDYYTVTLRPNHGVIAPSSATDSNKWTDLPASEMPDFLGTVINPISYNFSSQVISPGSTVTQDILVWTVEDKAIYGAQVSALPGVTSVAFTEFVYDMQVVLLCRTLEDETFKITTPWTPVHFANFDNCSKSKFLSF